LSVLRPAAALLRAARYMKQKEDLQYAATRLQPLSFKI